MPANGTGRTPGRAANAQRLSAAPFLARSETTLRCPVMPAGIAQVRSSVRAASRLVRAAGNAAADSFVPDGAARHGSDSNRRH